MSPKRDFWFSHVAAWRTSGLSQAEYARQHELSIKAFGYYRRRYFQAQDQPLPKPKPKPKPAHSILPVSIIGDPVSSMDDSQSGDACLVLTTPNGYRVDLASGFPANDLRQLLSILGAL